MTTTASATIRMYRLNELGDCFLITFSAGASTSHLLIDCGSFRNSAASKKRLEQITAQIAKDLDGAKIDVLVGTHQHNDHLSGFLHSQKAFEDITVGQVWLSWLDDPKDKTAQKIGADHNNLRISLHNAMAKMRAHPATARAGSRAARSLGIVTDMLGFFGATDDTSAPEVPMLATKLLKKLGKQPPTYLEPSDVLDMPGLPPDTVRIHVLGPPRAHDALFRKDPKKGESYDHALAASARVAAAMLDALDEKASASEAGDRPYPFGGHFKNAPGKGSPALLDIQKRYTGKNAKWRTIDDAWLETAGSLALYLDSYTNNSSLVLAIELVESGKVLLFAADAQTGNWASWKDIEWKSGHPGTAKLLERTVFYKVGHHASHNATLVDAFEQMGGDDLCALIPVHKQDPNITKKNGWKMPARHLFDRIVEKTEGRVLQMDGVNPPESDPTKAKVKSAWKRAGVLPKITPNSIELTIK
jgi:hypothetical protein